MCWTRCAVNCKSLELAADMYSAILCIEPRNGEALSYMRKRRDSEHLSLPCTGDAPPAIADIIPFRRRAGIVTYVLFSSIGNWVRLTAMLCYWKCRQIVDTSDIGTINSYY